MRILFLFIILLGLTLHADQPPAPADQQYFWTKNRLKNPGFELGRTSWTNSGATYTLVSLAASANSGIRSITWDAAAATDTLTSETLTVSADNGLSLANVVASCTFRVPTGTATHTLQIWDGTNVLASSTITSGTTYVRTSVNAVAPSSGTIALRIDATAADEPSIAIDDCFLGKAEEFNLSQVSQATMYGYLKYAGTTSCQWSTGNTGGAFTDFAADTDCPAPSVANYASAPSTKIPRIKFATLPPGEYQVIATGVFGMEGTGTTASAQYKLYDGTTYSGSGPIDVLSTDPLSVRHGILVGRFTYTTAQSNIEFRPVALSSSDSNDPNIYANIATTRDLEFTVYRFPTTAETAISSDSMNWQVIADITGANPSLGVSAVTSYTEIIDAGLTMTPVSGSSPVGIMCSTTNAAATPTTSTSTCSAGSESIGANFNIPRAGWYEACFQFGHHVQADSGEAANATFNVVHTPLTAQTLTYEGGPRITSGQAALTIATGVDQIITAGRNVCGQINFSSVGNVGIRLMYEQSVTGTPDDSVLLADANSSNGQRGIRITVKPLILPSNVPQTINSVINSSSGVTRIEVAKLRCFSTSAITSQHGSWVTSIGNISSGACNITLTSGIFSSTPYCFSTFLSGTTGGTFEVRTNATSTTAVSVANSVLSAGAAADATDFHFYFSCIGAK